jgi:hypothetical protein
MKRIYHPHTKWEDHQAGMYAMTCLNSHEAVRQCVKLLSNPYLLEPVMRSCAFRWVHSAQVNMTNPGRNRQAWLGQAACCYANGSPEYITKMAWRELTDEQRKAANDVADKIIKEWEKENDENANQAALFDEVEG